MKTTATPKGRSAVAVSAVAVPAAAPVAAAAAAPVAAAPVLATADATTADGTLTPSVGGFCWSRVILFILISLLFSDSSDPKTLEEARAMSRERVVAWATRVGRLDLEDIEKFKRGKYDGTTLLSMRFKDLKALGIALGCARAIVEATEILRSKLGPPPISAAAPAASTLATSSSPGSAPAPPPAALARSAPVRDLCFQPSRTTHLVFCNARF